MLSLEQAGCRSGRLSADLILSYRVRRPPIWSQDLRWPRPAFKPSIDYGYSITRLDDKIWKGRVVLDMIARIPRVARPGLRSKALWSLRFHCTEQNSCRRHPRLVFPSAYRFSFSSFQQCCFVFVTFDFIDSLCIVSAGRYRPRYC